MKCSDILRCRSHAVVPGGEVVQNQSSQHLLDAQCVTWQYLQHVTRLGSYQRGGTVALSTRLGQIVGLVSHLHRHVGHVGRAVDSLRASATVVVVGVVHGSWLLYVSCCVSWDSPNLQNQDARIRSKAFWDNRQCEARLVAT